MIFFDYLYYRICEFYYAHNSSSPRIAGLVILSLMYCLNFIFIYGVTSLILKRHIEFSKVSLVILYFSLLILNGIRYNKLNFDLLNKRWKGESENIKKKKQTMVMIYIAMSIISIIGLIFR